MTSGNQEQLRDPAFDGIENTASWDLVSIQDSLSESFLAIMREKALSKSDFAKKLGCSPAYVTKALRGDVNFTLESLVKFARALDSEVQVHISPRISETSMHWHFGLGRSAFIGNIFSGITPSMAKTNLPTFMSFIKADSTVSSNEPSITNIHAA